jgi:hypothetical protein
VVLSDFDQGGSGQAGFRYQVQRVFERHHVVGPGVKNLGAGLHRLGLPPVLPRWAEQHEPGRTRPQVHRDGPTPARPYHDLGLVLVKGCLGRLQRRLEVLVIQGRLDDLVAMGP